VSDLQFTDSYDVQLQTLRCYAALTDYKFALHPKLVAPISAKHHPESFYCRHCIVCHFLGQQPAGSAVVVLDVDAVGGVSSLSFALVGSRSI
jgi:hypothetical protein